jgi:cytochrome c biogenesis factor
MKGTAREFAVLITFASLVFLTALTRGGFTSSVHSYAVSLIGPILLTFGLGMTLYFFYLRRRIRRHSLPSGRRPPLPYASSLLMIFALAMIFLVCLIGILLPLVVYAATGQPFPLGADYFDTWNFPFLIVLVAGMIGCNLPATTRFRSFYALLAVGAIAGLVAAILAVPTANPYVDFGVPLLLIALAMVIYRLGTVLSARIPMQLGRSVIHIGLVVLLLGVLISWGGEGSSTILATTNSGVQEPISMMFGNATLSYSPTWVYYPRLNGSIPESTSAGIDTVVAFNGQIYYAVLNASFYPNYGLLFRPVIISTLGGDLYLHMEYTDSVYNSLVSVYLGNPSPPVNISVTVVTMPMVYLVWAGAILLNIGIAISLIYDIMGYHEDMRQEQQQEDPALRERGK